MARRAAFLDRDGVLTPERGVVTRADAIELMPHAAGAVSRIVELDFLPVIITNQTGMARGLMGRAELDAIHGRMNELLVAGGAPPIRAIFVCPHHPHAQVEAFRIVCACRKPLPGLVLRAAGELSLDLASSVFVGDRASDLACARRAGVGRAILVASAGHTPIVGAEDLTLAERTPDAVADDLLGATFHFAGAAQ